MKVLVTVKEVAEVADDFVVEDDEIDEAYLEYGLNEWDDYAVEAAVQLREAGIADEVVTATVGPERSEETIRMALAKGADRAVRIWDDAFDRDRLLDTSVRATLFGEVVEREDPELVLGGVQAADTGFGATGVALARRVGYEWAAVVNDLEVDPEAGVASVTRELEGGVEELSDIELPAVLTIQTGINEPRYASLRGIRQAQSKELEVLDLDALGVDPASRLAVTAMYEPESESEATVWEGDPEDTAGELAAFLRDRGVVQE